MFKTDSKEKNNRWRIILTCLTFNIKVNIEKLFYSLKGYPKVTMNDEVRDDVKFIFRKFITDSSRVCSTRTNKALHQTLENLVKNTAIKICKFDKGNGVAILDTNDYNAKLDAIIGDKSKFKEVLCNSNKHPLIAKEDSNAYYVRKYLKKHYDSRMIANLLPSGNSPGKLYGTVKVHKPNFPLRPVVSMVNTPEYALAKFLDNMIKPYLPQTRMLKSTDHFIEELKEFNPNSQNTMVSFDVISLFTNVPLAETIDIL